MAVVYSKKMLIERIKRHMADNFPSAEFGSSSNEVLLYIDQALAYSIVGQVWANAKVEGNMAMPEAYLTTYLLPDLQQDNVTKEWYSTLPQPPLSLPLGYSLDNVYFANSVDGKGTNVSLIKAKRVAYRRNLPTFNKVMAWVEGSKIIFQHPDGSSLLNEPVYARMASTRTSSVTDVMALPDDTIELIFNNVVAKLKDRMGIPKDIIQDDLPAGNKTS
jgi:hypothetical protein